MAEEKSRSKIYKNLGIATVCAGVGYLLGEGAVQYAQAHPDFDFLQPLLMYPLATKISAATYGAINPLLIKKFFDTSLGKWYAGKVNHGSKTLDELLGLKDKMEE